MVRRLLGDDVDRALHPLLAVCLLASVGNSAIWSFFGIWALDELGAGEGRLSAAFPVAAAAGFVAGWGGGALSDRVGRRPVLLTAWTFQAVTGLLYLAAGDRVWIGLGVFVLAGLFNSLGHASMSAMVADLVAPERRERAFASVRVVNNLGVTMGPAVGGLLLGGDGDRWWLLFVAGAAVSSAAAVVAWLRLPHRGAFAPEHRAESGSLGVIRRDHAFLVFLVGMSLAWIVYMSYETLLPISLNREHGLSPAVWGVLVALNPLVVTLFQLRVTRWSARFPLGPKLGVAMLLMGLPFTLLELSAAVPVVAVLILLFVVGEMLWFPGSQAVVSRMAPDERRGAYMGAFSGTSSVGFALAPLIGLNVRSVAGDGSMWLAVALVGVVGAAILLAVCRLPAVRATVPDEPVGVPAPA